MQDLNTQECNSKTERARAMLLALAHDRGPGMKLPTLEEMCAQFSMSRTALEPALKALEQRGLLRRRHGSGIYITERIRQKTIGVVFNGNIFSPDFSPYWGLLYRAVGAQADDLNMHLQAYLDISLGEGGLGGHSQLFEDLEMHRLDGLLLAAFDSTHEEVACMRRYGIPMVLIGGMAPDWVVTYDHDAGIRLAAQEIARQCGRRIALLGPPSLSPILGAELRQLDVTDVIIEDWSYETWARIIRGSGTHEHCAYRLTQQRIHQAVQHPLPEVLVSMEDTSTRGVITALLQAGRQPGRDLTIITSINAGSPVLDSYAEGLTCFTFDPFEQVRAALGMLEILMNGGTPPARHVLIAPTITAPPYPS